MIYEQPRPDADGHHTGAAVAPIGLAERIDDLLAWLEARANDRSTLVLLTALAVIGAGIGLLVLSGAGRVPVEDSIPFAPGVAASPDVGSVGGSGGADTVPAGEPASTVATEPSPDDETDRGGRSDAPAAVVHVIGAVDTPGLVQLEPPARVADAIEAAGGAAPGADLDRLNLAAPIVDGMQIRVPTTAEQTETVSGPGRAAGQDPLILLPPSAVGDVGLGGGAGGPVNLNRDGEERLQTLPGVGPATAAAIVAWRDEHGPFVVIDDLLEVPGIGPAKLAAVRDRVEL